LRATASQGNSGVSIDPTAKSAAETARRRQRLFSRTLTTESQAAASSSRGGIYSPESPMAALEHHESYLRAPFGFLGVTRLEFVRAEGVKFGAEQAEHAVTGALEQVAQLRAA
jgi:FMN-dependent NADH-azoreductase